MLPVARPEDSGQPQHTAWQISRAHHHLLHRNLVVIVHPARRIILSARRLLARGIAAVAQRRVLGYPAPMDMYPLSGADVEATIEGAGGTVLDVVPDPMYGGNWRYARYFATRR